MTHDDKAPSEQRRVFFFGRPSGPQRRYDPLKRAATETMARCSTACVACALENGSGWNASMGDRYKTWRILFSVYIWGLLSINTIPITSTVILVSIIPNAPPPHLHDSALNSSDHPEQKKPQGDPPSGTRLLLMLPQVLSGGFAWPGCATTS